MFRYWIIVKINNGLRIFSRGFRVFQVAFCSLLPVTPISRVNFICSLSRFFLRYFIQLSSQLWHPGYKYISYFTCWKIEFIPQFSKCLFSLLPFQIINSVVIPQYRPSFKQIYSFFNILVRPFSFRFCCFVRNIDSLFICCILRNRL